MTWCRTAFISAFLAFRGRSLQGGDAAAVRLCLSGAKRGWCKSRFCRKRKVECTAGVLLARNLYPEEL